MSRRTGLFWDAGAGRQPIPRVAASLGGEFVAADAARGTIQVPPAHAFIPLFAVPPAPRADCDHGAPAGWQFHSTHRTSGGTVAYARCPCGAWLVLLDGQPLAGSHPRPREAIPSVAGERPRGRGRWWLWDRGRAWWKLHWRWRQRERRADPDLW